MCGGPTKPWTASTVKSSLKAVPKKTAILLFSAKSDSRQEGIINNARLVVISMHNRRELTFAQ